MHLDKCFCYDGQIDKQGNNARIEVISFMAERNCLLFAKGGDKWFGSKNLIITGHGLALWFDVDRDEKKFRPLVEAAKSGDEEAVSELVKEEDGTYKLPEGPNAFLFERFNSVNMHAPGEYIYDGFPLFDGEAYIRSSLVIESPLKRIGKLALLT